MRARFRLVAVLTIALGAAAASSRAQNAQPPQAPPASQTPQTQTTDPQQPTFRTGVDVVTVDVAVVDGRGNPVEDLRAPDFAVKIDGQVRRVVSAELIKADVAAARRQADDKTESFYTSNLTPDNGRHIVIAVD
jgi:hypothetical protein